MPTYDYKCQKCGHTYEVFQGISAKLKTQCPKCRGKVKRLIGTGGGIIFKGSGFYQTDYKKTTTPVSKTGDAPAKSDTNTTTPKGDSAATPKKKENS